MSHRMRNKEAGTYAAEPARLAERVQRLEDLTGALRDDVRYLRLMVEVLVSEVLVSDELAD